MTWGFLQIYIGNINNLFDFYSHCECCLYHSGQHLHSSLRLVDRNFSPFFGFWKLSFFGFEVLHSSLYSILGQHRAVKLHRWERQVFGNVTVINKEVFVSYCGCVSYNYSYVRLSQTKTQKIKNKCYIHPQQPHWPCLLKSCYCEKVAFQNQ